LTSKKLDYEMVVVWHGSNCSISVYWLCLLSSLVLDLDYFLLNFFPIRWSLFDPNGFTLNCFVKR